MKNKKTLYFLIPLVLIVWGLIFYRIFNGLQDSSSAMTSFSGNEVSEDKNNLSDTFKLIANYRDPFLTGSFQAPKASETTGSLRSRHVLTTNNNVSVPPPNVQYYGIISNSKSKNKVGLIKFQGKDYLLKEGEVVSQLKIIKLFKDSLFLLYQNHKHSIKR